MRHGWNFGFAGPLKHIILMRVRKDTWSARTHARSRPTLTKLGQCRASVGQSCDQLQITLLSFGRRRANVGQVWPTSVNSGVTHGTPAQIAQRNNPCLQSSAETFRGFVFSRTQVVCASAPACVGRPESVDSVFFDRAPLAGEKHR